MEKYGKVKCTFCIWFLEAQYQEVTGEWSCLVPPLFKYDITPWIKEGPDQQHAMDIGFMCIGRCIRPHKSCNRGIVIMGCCKYIQMEASQLHVYYIYIYILTYIHLKAILKGRWYHRDISAQLRLTMVNSAPRNTRGFFTQSLLWIFTLVWKTHIVHDVLTMEHIAV